MNTSEIYFFSSGKKIAARLRMGDSIPQAGFPAIVINHGYSGDKQEYDEMARFLCERGFATLQFDSRGCGESEAKKGRMMCATEWMEDAVNAVSFMSSLEGIDASRIGFMGCSMGGAIALCMAALDTRIKCVVALAPMTDGPKVLETNFRQNRTRAQYESFILEILDDAKGVAAGEESRYVPVPYALALNEKDTQEYIAFRNLHKEMVDRVPLESVDNSFLLFRPLLYAQSIEIPVLILHGSADEIVDPQHSLEFYKELRCKKKRIVIDGAPHPLPNCDQAETVFAYTADWFSRNL